ERSHHRPRSVAVPVSAGHLPGPGSCCSAIAWPRQRLLKLSLDKLLNEAPHAFADTRLDRAEPVVKKMLGCISCRMQRLRLRAMDSHGGVGLHRRANAESFGLHTAETTPLSISTNFATAPRLALIFSHRGDDLLAQIRQVSGVAPST